MAASTRTEHPNAAVIPYCFGASCKLLRVASIKLTMTTEVEIPYSVFEVRLVDTQAECYPDRKYNKVDNGGKEAAFPRASCPRMLTSLSSIR